MRVFPHPDETTQGLYLEDCNLFFKFLNDDFGNFIAVN